MTHPSFETGVSDCVDWLKTLDSESVALCVTDPAYESLEKHRAHGTTTRLKVSDASSNQWFAIFRNGRWPDLMRELHRVLAPDAHLYVLADEETTYEVTKPTGQAAGFTWWKALTWVKTRAAVDSEQATEADLSIGMGYHWRATSERIAFLEKGKRRLANLGWSDVICAPRVRDGYPTEKPVSLLRRLIENSSSPGELVIDPFLGSGSTGEAALSCGRSFAGVDVSPDAVAAAHARLTRFGNPGAVTRAVRQGGLFG